VDVGGQRLGDLSPTSFLPLRLATYLELVAACATAPVSTAAKIARRQRRETARFDI
jgi:hypothetical protein